MVVTPVAGHGPTAAPASLADAAARIPGGGDARIRVERYTMPDGTRQFAVYVAGTQTVAPNSTEPFDMASNIALYTGERSASYDATLAALARAGAEPGDVVHAFGHSQGAMITAHLALEGGYDTQTLVSLGSPVEADVGEGTMSISLRHADDPVAALAAGGHAGGRRCSRQLRRRAHRRPRSRCSRLRAARARHRRLHRDGAAPGCLDGCAHGGGA